MVDRLNDNVAPGDLETRLFGASGHDADSLGVNSLGVAEAETSCAVRLRGRRGGRRAGRRVVIGCVLAGFGLALLASLAVVGFYIMLARGPISADGLGARIAAALDARLGSEYAVSLGRTSIERGDGAPTLSIANFQVAGRGGEIIFEAPRAAISVDPTRLLFGSVSPRRLDVFDLDLRLVVTPEGAVALSAGREPLVLTSLGGNAVDPGVAPLADLGAGHAAMRPVAAALRRLLALAVGSASPLAALERVNIARGRLVLEDQVAGRTTTFEGLEASFEKDGEAAKLAISADGPNGRWRVTALANGDASTAQGAARTFDLDIDNVSIEEIGLVAGWRDPPIDFDMPVSASLSLGLGANGGLEVASGRFSVDRGFFFIKDPDHEPLPVDSVTGGFRWDGATRKFDIQPVLFRSGRTQIAFTGRLTPPESGVGAWRMALTGAPGVFGSERPGETDIAVENLEIEAHINPLERSFEIAKFALAGPDVSFAMTGSGGWEAGNRRLSLRADASGSTIKAIARLWPSPIAAHTRAWLLDNQTKGVLQTGRMAIDLDEAAFVDIYEHRPVADAAVQIDFTVTDGELTFLPGAPALSGVAGKGRVTGRTGAFVASSGYIDMGRRGRLTLVDGRFDAPDFAQKPAPASVVARASGALETVNALLAVEAMKEYGGFVAEAGAMKGQVDARVNVDLKLGKEAGDDPAKVTVAAQISNMTIDKLIGEERLEQASLAVIADADGMKAAGSGRLFGSQVKIDLRKPLQGVAEAVLSMTLDEATRAKQGWSTGSSISGPIGARITAPIGMGDRVRPQIELDLTRAAINSVALGYVKPAGRPAKVSFAIAKDGANTVLQSFHFDGGTASAQGTVELDGEGDFVSAKLSQLRLSPGDDMRLDAQRNRNRLKLVVRGGTIDARPFVRNMTGAQGGQGAGDKSAIQDVDLDLKASLVTGHNGQSLSNVDLKLSKNAAGVQDLKLAARLGRAGVEGAMLKTAPGAGPQFYVRSGDGGAVLAFLDLYRRMDGGQLQLVAAGGGDATSGILTVRNFTLRNEAALRRLVTEGTNARDDRPPPIDVNAVPFDRLQVSFQRAGSRLTLRDGAIHGPTVGTTLEGVIDFGRDQVALNGTFVPAYGVNNLFAKIPLFGPILGGGANEGLIAVNFRISGSASAPMLSINPLSAIAPGFLRKIFGATDALQSRSAPVSDSRPAMPMTSAPMR